MPAPDDAVRRLDGFELSIIALDALARRDGSVLLDRSSAELLRQVLRGASELRRQVEARLRAATGAAPATAGGNVVPFRRER